MPSLSSRASRARRRAGRAAWAVVVVAVFASTFAGAGVARAAALRFQVNQKGDFVLLGNTLGQNCGAGVPAPVFGTVGACGTNTTDTAPDIFWRSDDATPAATADNTIALANARSTAVLSIPAGATITYARLYWSAVRATADTTVTVDRVGAGAFTSTVTADASATATSSTPQTYYQSTADVTTLVQTNGVGQYRISGVDGMNLINLNNDTVYTGWSMVVFYSLPTDPPRNLTIFDGLDLINSNGPSVTVSLTGFLVPIAGFDAKLGVITYEGDDQLTGDALSFNGVQLSNALNPVNNFFNGTRSYLGAAVSNAGDLPRLTGGARSLSSMDLDVVDVTARLTQGQTSATITASTNQDFYLLGAFITSISTYKPDFGGATKTVTDLMSHPGGAVLPGDTVEYTISATNNGNDGATNTTLNDQLPAGLTFVPGSIRVTAGPNTGTKTDAAGDDQGEYIAGTRTVRVRLGTGATAAMGGTMSIGAQTTVVFRVVVNSLASGLIENQAIITASGQAGAPATDYPSNGSGNGGTPTPTPIIIDQCAQSSDCSGATPYCLTTVSPHACVGCLSDTNCSGTKPRCDSSSHTCRACAADAECPSTKPVCLGTGACGECSVTNAAHCGGATPACDTSTATCVGCVTNATCGGATPDCNPTTKTCVGCLSNGDCAGATPVCDPAFLTCRGCGGDGECGGVTPACEPSGACGQCSLGNATACVGGTPVCETTTGTCVRCTANADCSGTTPICNGTTHVCAGCASDGQCGGATPACEASGACGQCSSTNASACGATTPVCNTTTSTCRSCAGDVDCHGATPACEPTGACGVCSATNNTQCTGATPVCSTSTGTCASCVSNAQCGGATPVCNTTTHVCRGCAGDGECGGSTPACEPSGACGQCSTTNGTACTGATPVCNTTTQTCVGCLTNATCAGTAPICNGASQTCRGCAGDGECGGATPACELNGACGQCSATNASKCGGVTPVCDTAVGACVACVSNAQCGGATPVCNTATHTCRACGGDGECGGATPACEPSGACGQCSTTNATACGGATSVCQTTTGTCVGCLASVDCGGAAPICNTTTHTCRGCAGDVDCSGATPACEPSGACGACSATNA
ncbi:MAG: cell surface repeat-containing protein, partial [Myxococcales bacterium]|nr:cell surface repeat-containing protein [Myxococcales bacterium]